MKTNRIENFNIKDKERKNNNLIIIMEESEKKLVNPITMNDDNNNEDNESTTSSTSSSSRSSSSSSRCCPICLNDMTQVDTDHPVLCLTKTCHYNFCQHCIQSLITSSKDDYIESSDGNRHTKIQLCCPCCRYDLSKSIRDTLLLRKVDTVLYKEQQEHKNNDKNNKKNKKNKKNDDDSFLSASELRLKHAMIHQEKIKKAIECARKREMECLSGTTTASTTSTTATTTTALSTTSTALPSIQESENAAESKIQNQQLQQQQQPQQQLQLQPLKQQEELEKQKHEKNKKEQHSFHYDVVHNDDDDDYDGIETDLLHGVFVLQKGSGRHRANHADRADDAVALGRGGRGRGCGRGRARIRSFHFVGGDDEFGDLSQYGVEVDHLNGAYDFVPLPPPPQQVQQPRQVRQQQAQPSDNNNNNTNDIDKSLFNGLDYFLSQDEQMYITQILTSGDPNQLAVAAQVLYAVAQMAHTSTTTTPATSTTTTTTSALTNIKNNNTNNKNTINNKPQNTITSTTNPLYTSHDNHHDLDLARRPSICDLIEENELILNNNNHQRSSSSANNNNHHNASNNANQNSNSPTRIRARARMTAASNKRHQREQFERELKQSIYFLKQYPLPVRMPKYVELHQWDDIEFMDYKWNGTVMDAYCNIIIQRNSKITQDYWKPKIDPRNSKKKKNNITITNNNNKQQFQQHYHPVDGIQNVLNGKGEDDYVQIEVPNQPRIIISQVSREASRLGVRKGDVLTHINSQSVIGKTLQQISWPPTTTSSSLLLSTSSESDAGSESQEELSITTTSTTTMLAGRPRKPPRHGRHKQGRATTNTNAAVVAAATSGLVTVDDPILLVFNAEPSVAEALKRRGQVINQQKQWH